MLTQKEKERKWREAGAKNEFFASFFNEEEDREQEDNILTADGQKDSETRTPASTPTANLK